MVMWHSRPRLCPFGVPRNLHSRGRPCHTSFSPKTHGIREGAPSIDSPGRGG